MNQPQLYKLPTIEDYLELDCGGFRVIGKSIAGVETVFALPQLNITFDTGRAPAFACFADYLALTHFHADHAGCLAYYLGLRNLNNLPALKIVVPDAKKAQAEDYLATIKSVTDSGLAYEVISAATSPITLKKNLTLKAIANVHCTPSTGYAVFETKKKLKAKFAGCSQDEILAAKIAGQEIDDVMQVPLIAFSGDSTAVFFATEAVQAKVLLMECSFIGDDVEKASIENYGHTHILDWRHHADAIQSEIVVMTHTSQRYTVAEVEAACHKHLPESLLKRLVVFRRG